jgi:hypothetical protein
MISGTADHRTAFYARDTKNTTAFLTITPYYNILQRIPATAGINPTTPLPAPGVNNTSLIAVYTKKVTAGCGDVHPPERGVYEKKLLPPAEAASK